MRRGLASMAVAVSALAVAAAPAGAATAFQLTAQGGTPEVAVDSAGNGHFVWNQA